MTKHKIEIEIDVPSLRLVQFNFVVWSILILTVAIHGIIVEYIPDIELEEVQLEPIHLTFVFASVIVIPIVYFVNRFYKTFLVKFVKVQK